MARVDSRSKGSSGSPQLDVYVGLAVVAFVALSIAIGFLIYGIKQYNGF